LDELQDAEIILKPPPNNQMEEDGAGTVPEKTGLHDVTVDDVE
jgi:hypothetical protein